MRVGRLINLLIYRCDTLSLGVVLIIVMSISVNNCGGFSHKTRIAMVFCSNIDV